MLPRVRSLPGIIIALHWGVSGQNRDVCKREESRDNSDKILLLTFPQVGLQFGQGALQIDPGKRCSTCCGVSCGLGLEKRVVQCVPAGTCTHLRNCISFSSPSLGCTQSPRTRLRRRAPRISWSLGTETRPCCASPASVCHFSPHSAMSSPTTGLSLLLVAGCQRSDTAHPTRR